MDQPDDAVVIHITSDDRLQISCDFCEGPDPVWRYPCADFDLPEPYRTGSVGDWVACEPCAAIIETVPTPIEGSRVAGERMADLASRSIDRVYPDGPPSAEDLLALGTFLFHLHGGFFRNRTGPGSRDA